MAGVRAAVELAASFGVGLAAAGGAAITCNRNYAGDDVHRRAPAAAPARRPFTDALYAAPPRREGPAAPSCVRLNGALDGARKAIGDIFAPDAGTPCALLFPPLAQWACARPRGTPRRRRASPAPDARQPAQTKAVKLVDDSRPRTYAKILRQLEPAAKISAITARAKELKLVAHSSRCAFITRRAHHSTAWLDDASARVCSSSPNSHKHYASLGARSLAQRVRLQQHHKLRTPSGRPSSSRSSPASSARVPVSKSRMCEGTGAAAAAGDRASSGGPHDRLFWAALREESWSGGDFEGSGTTAVRVGAPPNHPALPES